MKKPSKRRERVHKKTIIYIVVFVAIVAMAALYSSISLRVASNSEPQEDRRQIVLEVDKSYKANITSFTAHQEYENDLVAAGVVSSGIGSTQTSVCYIESVGGGGWTTIGYEQACYARFITGYYTNIDREAVREGLQKGEHTSRYTNDPQQDKTCIISKEYSPATVIYVLAGSKPSSIDTQDFLDYNKCGRPASEAGLHSNNRTLGTYLSKKYIQRLDTEAIDETKNQIWIEADYEYYRQAIPCASSATTFKILDSCGMARDEPIQ